MHAFQLMGDPATDRIYDVEFTEEDANIVLQSSDGISYRMPSFTLRHRFFFGICYPLPDEITMDENSMV